MPILLGVALVTPACLLALPLDDFAGGADPDAGGGGVDATSDVLDASDAGSEAAPVEAASCPPDKFPHGTTCITRPVVYWTLDEGSGQTVGDSTGNGVTGTLNGAQWVPGHVGAGALSFDGKTASVLFGRPDRLKFASGSFAYSMLIFQDEPMGMYDIAWWNGGSSASYPGYDLELGSVGWGTGLSDGTKNVVAGFGPPVSGKWTRLVVVVDREKGELRTYLNGAPTESRNIAAFGSLAAVGPATLGAGIDTDFFHGTIDDVLFFDRIPTAEDLTALNP